MQENFGLNFRSLFKECLAFLNVCPFLARFLQGGPGTEPEPETGTGGTAFAGTERGTGTVGTVFQEPKPEPEPSSL